MATALVVRFKRPLPRGEIYGSLRFAALGDQFEALDEVAWEIGTRPLSRMMEGYSDDDDPWFSAKDGVMSIGSILAYLQNNPDAVRDPDAVMDDLRGVKKPLSEAAEESVPFRFAMV